MSNVLRSDSVSSLSSVSSNPGALPKHPIGLGDKNNLGWKLDNKCFICLKKFGLGARHHCRYCGNSVCGKHSSKKTLEINQEITRICDNCEIEMIKEKIRSEIKEELNKIYDNIEITKEIFEKTENERLEKNKIAEEIGCKLTEAEKNFRQQEDELTNKLNEVLQNIQKSNEKVENIKNQLNSSYISQKEKSQKCDEIELKIQETKDRIIKQHEHKNELVNQLDHIGNKIMASLPADQVANNLCEKCRPRVMNEATPHIQPLERD